MPEMDIYSIGELFERTQVENVFPDGKTFVDCTPLHLLPAIINLYKSQKDLPEFDLRSFIKINFQEPPAIASNFQSERTRSAEEHINFLWDELTRQPASAESSLLQLPYPYIVPGGRFREIFYWDSYFTMLGLRESGKITMIENMVDNFAFLIDDLGYIPNGNRTYFTGRSQPPFFAAMIELLAEIKGPEIFGKYLPQLLKEHLFWMKDEKDLDEKLNCSRRVVRMKDGSVLNRYYDENSTPRPESYKEDIELAERVVDKEHLFRNLRAACESGWDFSSRWFKEGVSFSTIHTTDIIPVDLNCLLFNLEKVISKALEIGGDYEGKTLFLFRAEIRKEALVKYCWNEHLKCFFDFDFVSDHQKLIYSAAATFSLYFGLASQSQSESISKMLTERLLRPGGIVTTEHRTGQQWDAPNGWAPLQWISALGLKRYGHIELASEIAKRWTALNEKVYAATGKMMEKYNVEDLTKEAGGGEYSSQDGFGWTNAVYLAFKHW